MRVPVAQAFAGWKRVESLQVQRGDREKSEAKP